MGSDSCQRLQMTGARELTISYSNIPNLKDVPCPSEPPWQNYCSENKQYRRHLT